MRLLTRVIVIVVGVAAVLVAVTMLSPETEFLAPLPAPRAAAAPLTSDGRFLREFDWLMAQNDQPSAVAFALAMMNPQPASVGCSAAEREALRQRLLDLLPRLDDQQAQEVLRITGAAGAGGQDAAWRQAVLARVTRMPASPQRAKLVRQAIDGSAAGGAVPPGAAVPPSGAVPPGGAVPSALLTPLLADHDPRLRAAAAAGLRRAAAAGDGPARAALTRAAAGEADPRVRQVLQGDHPEHPPAFPEDQYSPIVLPPAAARAPARTVETIWDAERSDGAPQYRNHSTITIDPDGQAHIDTMRESLAGDQDIWHVRYDGWAWVDATGATVIDGRGQTVDYLIAKPPNGFWIPDSLHIAPDGTTTLIDDHHVGRTGETAVPGSG